MALLELPLDHDLSHLRRSLEYVKSFRIAIDAGAHQGIWTKSLMEVFGRVFSFEPVESNYEKLTTINPDSFRVGLGCDSEKVSFSPGKDNTGQYHVDGSGDIGIVALDDFNFCDVDFLKLDVEGYELFALQGAEQTILINKPVILIEENGLCERYGVIPGSAGKYLENLGYTMVKKMNKDYLYCIL